MTDERNGEQRNRDAVGSSRRRLRRLEGILDADVDRTRRQSGTRREAGPQARRDTARDAAEDAEIERELDVDERRS